MTESIRWQPIESAPRNGTYIVGRRSYVEWFTGKLRYERHKTFWGKTSHIPLYGWNYGRDVENQNLWEPTHWIDIDLRSDRRGDRHGI